MRFSTPIFLFFLLLSFLPDIASADEKIPIDLSKHEFRVHSQNGEDGVLEKIFDCIGKTSCFYVEFGTESGDQCNTRLLRESGWGGLLMDGSWHISEINLQKEFITSKNINSLFHKYGVPDEFDLLSIDIDFNDFYVWKAISSNFKPRVVVIEYNATHLPHEDKVVRQSPSYMWDGTNYFGASLLAMYNLGRSKGYSLVYAESMGVNLFFIRDDVLELLPYTFVNTNNVEAIYMPPKYGIGPNGGHRKDPNRRRYLSSSFLMKN